MCRCLMGNGHDWTDQNVQTEMTTENGRDVHPRQEVRLITFFVGKMHSEMSKIAGFIKACFTIRVHFR